MNMINKIKLCESDYIKCFSKVISSEKFKIYEDSLLPDMHKHNYFELAEELTEEQAKLEIELLFNNAMSENKGHLLIECLFETSYKSGEKEHLGAYVLQDNVQLDWKTRTDCIVKKITTQEMVEQLVELDLVHDKLTCGEDFCVRRAKRRGQVYLSSALCNSYICYLNGKPVANCDLFFNGECAKIEDFAVLPEYQKQGIGTTVLKEMVNIAKGLGAKTIYLCADEDDTAKDMYVKLGFSKVMDFYYLKWIF